MLHSKKLNKFTLYGRYSDDGFVSLYVWEGYRTILLHSIPVHTSGLVRYRLPWIMLSQQLSRGSMFLIP